MHKGVYAVLEELRSGRLSRNRNFDAFEGATAQRAHRVYRRLRALERELARPDIAVRVERAEDAHDRFAITLERPAVRLRRVAYVEGAELALLCEDPRVRERLQLSWE